MDLTLSILGMLLVVIGNFLATQWGHAHYKDQDQQQLKIFDLGHALIPQVHIPEVLMNMYTGLWIPFLWMIPPSEAMKISVETGTIYIAMMVVRALTTVVTILPKSDDTCDATQSNWYSLLDGCYDKVFSGHTLLAALISLSFVSHGIWPVWGGWLYTAGMVLMLLFSRGHYTVDIVLGLVMAWLGWNSTLRF